MIDSVVSYLSSGGYVMPPLLLGAIFLWYAIGYRFSAISQCKRKQDVRILLDSYLNNDWSDGESIVEKAIINGVDLMQKEPQALRRYLDDAFWLYEISMRSYKLLIKIIVSVAPLLGLLGTVIGMIETFDSLRDMSLYKQDGGIAAGISQALITTQFGLVVAIPGLLISGILNKRERNILIDLDQLKDLLCSFDQSDKRVAQRKSEVKTYTHMMQELVV